MKYFSRVLFSVDIISFPHSYIFVQTMNVNEGLTHARVLFDHTVFWHNVKRHTVKNHTVLRHTVKNHNVIRHNVLRHN